MARILLTGSSGQVGSELVKTLAPLGELVAPLRGELDLSDVDAVRSFIRVSRPRWIVNPAAYTAVDKAESETELAYTINRDSVQAIGEAASEVGSGVIHFSTDYVFDGTKNAPYVEDDRTDPVSVYGASKLAGEQALAASGAAHMIFRTSWVYGTTGKNFLRTILRLAREREVIRVVADQHGAPTWSRDLARMTAHAIARVEAGLKGRELAEATPGWRGVYHAAGAGETTWCGFATEAIRLASEREPGMHFARVEAISTAEYPTPAKRPPNSRMSGARLAERFGWTMMTWRDSLREVIAEL
jgi:dTDP-4-dehydrorhamnose reductase